MGSPIFFIQKRAGLHGSVFRIYKFRTMVVANFDSSLDESTARITKLGKILRRFSIDELPQIYNVLIGDMSFVGPRPLLVEYLSEYSLQQAKRLEVRPGITGWAQINGRNSIDWNERFKLDAWYVENSSFLLDLKIIGRTFFAVFKENGINSGPNTTMKKFRK